MSVELVVSNESSRKRLYRSDALARLANRIYEGEGHAGGAELSLLFCDDGTIEALNHEYRGKAAPTDVLSFPQEGNLESGAPGAPVRLLGDIVISLETVERQCRGERAAMRREVYLLFCHGMLHILGYQHDTAQQQARMAARQAAYLRWPLEAAWPAEPAR